MTAVQSKVIEAINSQAGTLQELGVRLNIKTSGLGIVLKRLVADGLIAFEGKVYSAPTVQDRIIVYQDPNPGAPPVLGYKGVVTEGEPRIDPNVAMPMSFDSDEEQWMAWYLQELQDAGYVARFSRAASFLLAPEVRRSFFKGYDKKSQPKYTEKALSTEHVYTPDFRIEWTPKAIGGKQPLVQDWRNETIWPSVPFYGTLVRQIVAPVDGKLCVVENSPHSNPGVPVPDGKHLGDFWDVMVSYLEVKPFFNAHGKTQFAAASTKVVRSLFGTFVQIVKVGNKPKGIFADSFTPAKFLTTAKTQKSRTLHYAPKTLLQFLETPVG